MPLFKGIEGNPFSLLCSLLFYPDNNLLVKSDVFSYFYIILIDFQVRNLKSMGYRVPLAIVRQANDANQYYPLAISLIESVRAYDSSVEKV